MLPRKDLVKQRLYFLVDLLCVLVSYLIHGRGFLLILLQNIQHAFYFLTWENSWAAKRVASWSSLDWDRGRWNQIDLVVGTVFDILVHAMNVFFLAPLVNSNLAVFLTMSFSTMLIGIVLYNPKLAWAKSQEEAPDWVKNRIQPLSEDQRQEIPGLESLGSKLF